MNHPMVSIDQAATDGDSFTATSNTQSITGDGEVALLYLKNIHPTRHVRLWRLIFTLGDQGGGPGGPALFRVFDATQATGPITEPPYQALANNRQLGNHRAMPLQVKSGWSTGIAGATQLGPIWAPEASTIVIPTEIVVPYGAAVAVTVQPPVSSVSLQAAVLLVCSFFEP